MGTFAVAGLDTFLETFFGFDKGRWWAQTVTAGRISGFGGNAAVVNAVLSRIFLSCASIFWFAPLYTRGGSMVWCFLVSHIIDEIPGSCVGWCSMVS